MTFPIYGKIKNVPNHQPVEYVEIPLHRRASGIFIVHSHESPTQNPVVKNIYVPFNECRGGKPHGKSYFQTHALDPIGVLESLSICLIHNHNSI